MKQRQLLNIIEQYIAPPLEEGLIATVGSHFKVLEEWSAVFNLTGPGKVEELADSLYIDALLTSRWLKNILGSIAEAHDVGSGAGFPGLFIPLFFKGGTRFTLHEARRKKSSFLRTAAREMGLVGVDVKNDRVIHGAFTADLVTSRATFAPQEWLALAATLLRSGGHAVVYFSERTFDDDDEPYGPADADLEMRLKAKFNYTLPLSGKKRSVCIFEKL